MQDNKLTLPAAIIIAGILIGGAVIFTRSSPPANTNPANTDAAKTTTVFTKTANIKPVTSADHILGDPNAKILAVEYSDTECPFCKTFAVTMEKIIETYGKDSTVAWVYRQYPIVGLHPKSPKEAEATECVNQLAGNDVFWKYLQKIYAVTPSNNGLDAAQLPILAASFGVDKKAFQACLDSNEFTAEIQSDVADATAAGAQGTPYTVLVPKNKLSDVTIKQITDMFTTAALEYKLSPDQIGYVTADKNVVINGNLPYELVQQIIAAMVS
jgi:protein-disulfide isomerase